MKIKYKVYEIRTQKNLSIRELSKLSGVSKSLISAIENDKRGMSVHSMLLLSEALEIHPDELYCYELD